MSEFCEDFVSVDDCQFFMDLYDGCNPESTYHNYVSANCKKFCGICTPLENPGWSSNCGSNRVLINLANHSFRRLDSLSSIKMAGFVFQFEKFDK